MKAVYQDEQVAVFDDVLPPEQFRALWDDCQSEPWQSVHAEGRNPSFGLDDGEAFWGRSLALASIPLDGLLPPDLDPSALPIRFHPTGRAVDPALEAMRQAAATVPHLVGKEGEDWAGINVRPYAYPRGPGLAWHEDSGPYSGAVIYYTHLEWNVAWGGELLFADPAPAGSPERAALDVSAKNAAILDVGTGGFVMPKPNRLVFIAPGCRHMIAQVTSAAGNHPRMSLAGFFVTPAGVAKLVELFAQYLGMT